MRPRSEPSLLLRPRGVASLDAAAECIELYEHYCHPLDDAQKTTIELALAVDRRGYWAAKTVGRAVARQAGKGDEIEAIELWGLVVRGEAIVHTAHEIPTSKAAHKRLAQRFHAHRDLDKLIEQVRYANGDQSIELTNGGIVAYRTRTLGGGRGLDDISRVVVDEAQHAQPEQLASLTPILSVNPNPQTLMAGTGAISGKSAWWWQQRIRALRGDNVGFAWHEHSAEKVWINDDGDVESIAPDPLDRDFWYRAHPALAAGRISEEFLEEQMKLLVDPDLFAREYLCVWDPLPTVAGVSRIDDESWTLAGASGTEIVGKVAVAVDCDFGLTWASIAVCGRCADGVRQVEIHVSAAGTAWIDSKLTSMLETTRDIEVVAVDASGPARALVPMIDRIVAGQPESRRAAGLKAKKLSGSEYAAACDAFEAAVPGELRHLTDVTLTNQALSTGARKYGTDAWIWDRRHGEITALVAATVAFSAADGLATTTRRSAYEDHGLEVV